MMKKTTLTLTLFAALGVSACQSGGANNSANATGEAENANDANESIDINTSAIGESIENTATDARNLAGQAGRSIENGLDKAGEAIENTASSAVREVREATDGANQRETTNKSR